MNMPLYRQMLVINLKMFMNYAVGSAFYILLMFWIYPGIAKNSSSLNSLIDGMPEGLGKAFGLENGFGSIGAFISGEYYGLLYLLILSIFCILVSTQLIAKLVDQGSMAYLLSAPTTRTKVALTQAAVLLSGLVLICAVTTLAGFAGYAWFIGDLADFDGTGFVLLNAGALLLFFCIGGISYLISACCNDEKRALTLSGVVTIGFFSLNLIGKISGQLSWMRHISVFSLFDPGEIVGKTADWPVSVAVLAGLGAVAFAAGMIIFRKRSLPL